MHPHWLLRPLPSLFSGQLSARDCSGYIKLGGNWCNDKFIFSEHRILSSHLFLLQCTLEMAQNAFITSHFRMDNAEKYKITQKSWGSWARNRKVSALCAECTPTTLPCQGICTAAPLCICQIQTKDQKENTNTKCTLSSPSCTTYLISEDLPGGKIPSTRWQLEAKECTSVHRIQGVFLNAPLIQSWNEKMPIHPREPLVGSLAFYVGTEPGRDTRKNIPVYNYLIHCILAVPPFCQNIGPTDFVE